MACKKIFAIVAAKDNKKGITPTEKISCKETGVNANISIIGTKLAKIESNRQFNLY